MKTTPDDPLRRRALALGLHGVLVHWNTIAHEPWLARLIELEEAERKRRNYERRLRGFVWSGMEECDDGPNNCNGLCNSACMLNFCGDGCVAGAETCDDGNMVDDDACRNNCTRCGDGVQNGNESCDDGNLVDDDACSNECVAPRLVFVTGSGGQNGRFVGNLGGLAGADAKCSAAASAALLPGTWKAWLSDDTGSPSTRFDTKFTGWYRLVDGTPVARGWAGLTTPPLKNPINLTEAGQAPMDQKLAWSNTTATGIKVSATHCSNWTMDLLLPKGRLGDTTATTNDWSDLNDPELNPFSCGTSLHLYCFQDP